MDFVVPFSDRKSTRLNSSHLVISYAVFCLKKNKDGRDMGENYTYTQSRVSPCAKAGQLDCIHCHTSSGRYKFREPAMSIVFFFKCRAAPEINPFSHPHPLPI